MKLSDFGYTLGAAAILMFFAGPIVQIIGEGTGNNTIFGLPVTSELCHQAMECNHIRGTVGVRCIRTAFSDLICTIQNGEFAINTLLQSISFLIYAGIILGVITWSIDKSLKSKKSNKN